MSILQDIFRDLYEIIEYTCHPREVELENIDKMIHCGDPSFGGALYCCEKCGHTKFVPFRCHSRFCPTCGVMYSIKRTTAMSFKLIRCTHRHCVFTIAEELRPFFLADRSLLNCLFQAVNQAVSRFFYNINHKRQFVPGFICVLHTFGRDLKWNPHIHCIISEGGFDKDGFWRPVTHFNYKYFRKAFQTVLLNLMQARLPAAFKKVKAQIYNSSSKGFYVYMKPHKCQYRQILSYIGRYLGRPVIATSRIDNYDRVNDTVTFHYNRHEDNKLIYETIPALEFAKRLMRHIPEKHFKMIRYYGIYARHRDSDKWIRRAIPSEKRNAYRSFSTWRNAIILAFGYDPIRCPECGHTMKVQKLYYRYKKVSLYEMYLKICRKSEYLHPPLHSPSHNSHIVVSLFKKGGDFYGSGSYPSPKKIHPKSSRGLHSR